MKVLIYVYYEMKANTDNKRYNNSKNMFKYKFIGHINSIRFEGAILANVFLLLGIFISSHFFPFNFTVLSIFAVMGIVTAGSWVNYVFDKDLDENAGKNIDFLRYISKKEMLFSSLILSFLSLILLFLINIYVFVLGLILIFVFFFYSAPPLRFKTIPPFDSIANSLGFGIIPFFIGCMILNTEINSFLIINGVIIGLPVISYYLFISSYDIEKDREFNIKTSCTKLGFDKTITVGIFLFFVGLFLSFIFTKYSILTITFIFCSPLILALKVRDMIIFKKLITMSYFVWTVPILLFLSYYSKSIIPISILIIVSLMLIYVIYFYYNLT